MLGDTESPRLDAETPALSANVIARDFHVMPGVMHGARKRKARKGMTQNDTTEGEGRIDPENSGRDAQGRFAAGPGNRGKPKGAKHRSTQVVEALLQGEAQKLTRRAVEVAMTGDTAALRLCLERLSPPRKAEGPCIELPELEAATTPAAQADAVIRAAARGVLSVDAARALCDAIASAMKIREIDEIERRLSALESGVNP